MFFHTFLNHNFWEQNLSNLTPLQTWWDLKDIAQQDREKIIIFDYLELLYKGIYIHTAQRCSLNPLNTFPIPKVKFTWLQRPWWRAIFRNTAILDIIPVIYYKLVSQATVFVTSHNTTPHEREGKGEEGGALCDETKTRRWETTYKLDLNNTTLDTWIATFSNLAAWLVSTLIKTLNFVSFSSFFCHVAQIQVLLTTLHLQILAIIGSRTHKPFGMSF